MKKKILFLALIFSVLVLSFMLSSCNNGTDGLEFIDINDDECGVKCGEAKSEEKIVIPKKHNGKAVTTIFNSAFSGCTELKAVEIPKSITKIEKGAFYKCNNLENVYYSRKITEWCNIEFEHSTANPMSVGKSFYAKNTLANEIKLSGIEKIKSYAFFGFECLYKVTIEDVTSIGDNAFAGCINLNSVQLPSNLKYIDKLTFSSCESLKEITIPAGTSIIHPHAFLGCELRSVNFENTKGWYKTTKEEDTKGEDIDVTDGEANAKAIRSKEHIEFWKRKFKVVK